MCFVAIGVKRVSADNADRSVDQTVGAVFFAVSPVILCGVCISDADSQFSFAVFGKVVEFAVEFVRGVFEGERE